MSGSNPDVYGVHTRFIVERVTEDETGCLVQATSNWVPAKFSLVYFRSRSLGRLRSYVIAIACSVF